MLLPRNPGCCPFKHKRSKPGRWWGSHAFSSPPAPQSITNPQKAGSASHSAGSRCSLSHLNTFWQHRLVHLMGHVAALLSCAVSCTSWLVPDCPLVKASKCPRGVLCWPSNSRASLSGWPGRFPALFAGSWFEVDAVKEGAWLSQCHCCTAYSCHRNLGHVNLTDNRLSPTLSFFSH